MSDRPEAITRKIDTCWIILRRSNGHFEPVTGSMVQGIVDRDDAIAKSEALAKQHTGQIFSVLKLEEQFVYEPIMVKGDAS